LFFALHTMKRTELQRRVLVASVIGAAVIAAAATATATHHHLAPHVTENVRTTFAPAVATPKLAARDYVHPLASVIGAVDLGDDVFVAPGASIRGDEGTPIHIGAGSNVQDGVVIHALETFDDGHPIEANTVLVSGARYAVYVGAHVSVAHQAQIHGPASVGDNTFVGMQALVFRAEVGANCVLEPRALVKVPPQRYVPAGAVIRTQADADALPRIDADYSFAHLNDGVLHVNEQLAEGYARQYTP
jgi:carbonic anhydrase/acetyltransferase-like protein (isoleucine patch superfamily)